MLASVPALDRTSAPPRGIFKARQATDFWRMALLQLIVWTFFAVVFIPQTYFSSPRRHITIPQAFIENVLAFYPWILISPLVLWLCKRYPFTRNLWPRNLAIHLVASLPIAVLEVILLRALYLWSGLAKELAPFYLTLAFAGCFDLLVYWSIVGVGQGIRYFREAEEQEHRLTEAQLQMLKGQLQPHFLFNTLNAVTELVYDRPEAADRVLTNLSELLRSSLRQDSPTACLADDLKFVRHYVDIQKELLKDRLQVSYDVDPEALPAMVPSMLIQPLVENAIKHGIGNRTEGGKVSVYARRDNDYVEIIIKDNGKGAARDGTGRQVAELSASGGIGLNNLRARLNQLYAGDHSMRITAYPDAGFIVSIVIPYREVLTDGPSCSYR
ncbi:MAG TPA: sensor histidine kinase [Terracidiphilus sp.]